MIWSTQVWFHTPGEALPQVHGCWSRSPARCGARGEWLPALCGSAGSRGKLGVVGSQPHSLHGNQSCCWLPHRSQQRAWVRSLEVAVDSHSALTGLQAGNQRLGVTIQGEMNTVLLWSWWRWHNLEQGAQRAFGGFTEQVSVLYPRKL